MQEKKFQRRVEDFLCEHCGASVKGTGYTNHCPQCLWSKHVDIHPGDRAEACGGLMKPVAVEGSTPEYRLVQVCERCGATRRVNVSKDDNVQTLLFLISSR